MRANILIVDDSPTMRRMIKKTLSMCGLNIGELFEAANGIEALAAMSQHTVAVALVDINMPVMNGVQLLIRMHADERIRDIPVIIASTEGSETRIRELMDKGARGYVRKPFHPEQIRDVLLPFVGAAEKAEMAVDDGDDMAF